MIRVKTRIAVVADSATDAAVSVIKASYSEANYFGTLCSISKFSWLRNSPDSLMKSLVSTKLIATLSGNC